MNSPLTTCPIVQGWGRIKRGCLQLVCQLFFTWRFARRVPPKKGWRRCRFCLWRRRSFRQVCQCFRKFNPEFFQNRLFINGQRVWKGRQFKFSPNKAEIVDVTVCHYAKGKKKKKGAWPLIRLKTQSIYLQLQTKLCRIITSCLISRESNASIHSRWKLHLHTVQHNRRYLDG